MANDYFQFKQFLIKQDQCAMKVCTDSCVLGASVEVDGATRVLDIGAGTGLLSLMVAQRTSEETQIEAVEIDAAAAQQAKTNISASPWANRIQLHAQSLQEFAQTQPEPFDVIISNPPFFQASLKSADSAKNVAKHTETLSFNELLQFAHQYLTPSGRLHILLPPHEAKVLEREAHRLGFHTYHILWLEATPGGKLLRAIHSYAKTPAALSQTRLAVREKDNAYTAEFQALLRPFYLIF
ncbi:methyltransferase [Nibribacter ruber]|uniref:tRNA1(Val) (adenine(37)-N6)-methyltransferase n=1 Tax=Nibribacter ruber TaxID=2698458 RepID=A0A6P1NW28_9BACT|nr:methyltransferase [Nibribacter ruber]QHL87270.1 methyltransferase [Nibribacter ruber]